MGPKISNDTAGCESKYLMGFLNSPWLLDVSPPPTCLDVMFSRSSVLMISLSWDLILLSTDTLSEELIKGQSLIIQMLKPGHTKQCLISEV